MSLTCVSCRTASSRGDLAGDCHDTFRSSAASACAGSNLLNPYPISRARRANCLSNRSRTSSAYACSVCFTYAAPKRIMPYTIRANLCASVMALGAPKRARCIFHRSGREAESGFVTHPRLSVGEPIGLAPCHP